MYRFFIFCFLLTFVPVSMGEVIEIILDLSEITGEMKPLLGVNAGPSPIGDYHNPILTNQYQSIGVRSIRNHDIYRAHSMSGFYPDRTCNPETRTCYNFFTSDSSFSKIIEGGFEPYFRIGDGYDMVKPPSPQEYENWSDAAVKVISHYREGLWDGFISDMKYVEIWNEPDNIHFWPKPHTAEDFFHLYSITAKKIKMAFPDLKVGGPGFTQGAIKTENGRQFVRSFLAFVKKNNIPLDFISWHMYSNNPDDYEEAGLFFDSLLAEYELENVENHCTEYNTDTKRRKNGESEYALRAGSSGAAILTASWISLQNCGVDQAFVYRGNDPSQNAPEFYGIFYANGSPKKSALAFSFWSAISGYQKRISLHRSDMNHGLYAIAGQDSIGNIGALLSNTNNAPQTVSIIVEGANYDVGKGYLLSDLSEQIQEISIDNRQISMPSHSVFFIPIKKEYYVI